MDRSSSNFNVAGRAGKWEVLPVLEYSDGDPSKHPSQPPYRPGDASNYLKDLAAAWKQRWGVNYYLDKLPDGYRVFEVPQPGGNQMYKRLFGHPSGRFFDSIKTFTPHFLWLMGGKVGKCGCKQDTGHKAPVVPRQPRIHRENLDDLLLPPRRQDSGKSDEDNSDNAVTRGRRARRDLRPAGGPADVVDEEGTEDIYKKFVMRLYAARDSKRGIDDDVVEPSSLDWRATHDEESNNVLPRFLRELEHQPSFLPRVGEVVLWTPLFLNGHYLIEDKKDGLLKFFSFEQRRFSGVPQWRAGVITAIPNAEVHNGQVDFHDILQLPKTNTDISTAGYRVETLPNPNDAKNKSASKQYKYVPLRSIRPMAQWQTLLRGIPQQKLHPSIMHALTSSTSFNLVEKVKCTGAWPNGVIHCKAVYLGAELVTAGDTVRLASPTSPDQCTKVLRVESVRLHLDNMKDEHGTKESQALASRIWVSLVGRAYTTNCSQHYQYDPAEEDNAALAPVEISQYEAEACFVAMGTRDYGPWYHLHDPRYRYEVSIEQVLGRLHEPKAVRLWNGQVRTSRKYKESLRTPELSYDVGGILAARRFATKMDRRLPPPEGNEILWYWADTRALALSVESFNGLEVSHRWDIRDKPTMDSWHEHMKIINGVQIKPGIDNNFVPTPGLPQSTRGRKKGSRLVDGKLVYPGDPLYEQMFGGENLEQADSRPSASSKMAGAAMVFTDEESIDEDDADLAKWTAPPAKWTLLESDAEIQVYESGADESRERSMRGAPSEVKPASKIKAITAKKEPLSKAAIMSGEVLPSIEGDDMDTEESDYYNYVPPARGGTEESEGGDYDPKKETRHRGRRSVSDW